MIITRNVDLSVGSTLGLAAFLTGRLFVAHAAASRSSVVFLIGMAFGALLGLVNGALVAFGRVPALVVTLGTLYVFRGVFLEWAGSDRINAADMPHGFLGLGTRQSSASRCYLIALVVLVGVGFFLRTAPAAASSTRSAPTRTPRLYGLPVTGGCSGRSSQRRARRPRRGLLRRPLRHLTPAPAATSSWRLWPPR